MPAANFIQIQEYIEYTGANGAEVITYSGGSLVSDNGTVMVADLPPGRMTFTVGDRWSNAGGFYEKEYFEQIWIARSSLVSVGGEGTMDGVSVAVPLLLLGASVDRVVTWNRPFADANYKVSFLPDAGTLGRITPVVKSGTKTASGLTVTISAGLAVTVAGALHVLGTT